MGIPYPKFFYAFVQGCFDAEELSEQEEEYSDIAKARFAFIGAESEQVMRINFRNYKNVQVTFKKLFDYLKCHWVIRELRQKQIKTSYEITIGYGNTLIELDQISVRLGKKNDEIKKQLQETYSFHLRINIQNPEHKEVEELFNKVVTYMSAEACYKYFELYQYFPNQWNHVATAFNNYVSVQLRVARRGRANGDGVHADKLQCGLVCDSHNLLCPEEELWATLLPDRQEGPRADIGSRHQKQRNRP
eukprot:TRINITY_DN12990_c0_g3_i1.p1 TRINITY_DN12990_c0_g3~~TRINITY_DN12990_c0_g3_i1.p1  ORF type:complete len:247 (-),score=23.42 TRINITY_DN12990_c0_g3_i1:194-934(-)